MDDEQKGRPRRSGEQIAEQKRIGARMRKARERSGLTLDQAAEALGIGGKGTLGHWETGARAVDSTYLSRLAALYGVTTDALLVDAATATLTREAQAVALSFDLLPPKDKERFVESINDRLLAIRMTGSRSPDAPAEGPKPKKSSASR